MHRQQNYQQRPVDSGKKRERTAVPPLSEVCCNSLLRKVKTIKDYQGLPFRIVIAILDKVQDAKTLLEIERIDPHLAGSTQCFWVRFCKKDFPKEVPRELEGWREMHQRCTQERSAKLVHAISRNKSKYGPALHKTTLLPTAGPSPMARPG